jgi:prophage antirepressor-like protein
MQLANDSYEFTFDSKPIRALLINDKPWISGKDVATILGYIDKLFGNMSGTQITAL